LNGEGEIDGVTYTASAKRGSAIVGLGLGISDLTGELFQFFIAVAVSIEANGNTQIGLKADIKVPVSTPYLTGKMTATYDVDKGSVFGDLTSRFQVPPNDGEYVDISGKIFFLYSSSRYNIRTSRSRHISGKVYESLSANLSFNLAGGANQAPSGSLHGNFKWKPRFDYEYPRGFNASNCDQAVAQVGRGFGINVKFSADIKGRFNASLQNSNLNARMKIFLDSRARLKCKIPYIFWAGSNCLRTYNIHIKGNGTAQYKDGEVGGEADVTVKYNGDVLTSFKVGNL
jgi:hypothetical protein